MHRDFDLTLPDGVVYSQRIPGTKETEELDEHFMIEKQYSFTQDSEVIGEETLNLGFYRQNAMDEILGEAGFESSASTTTGSPPCTRTATGVRRRAVSRVSTTLTSARPRTSTPRTTAAAFRTRANPRPICFDPHHSVPEHQIP